MIPITLRVRSLQYYAYRMISGGRERTNYELKLRDIQSLYPDRGLSDAVIDFYVRLVRFSANQVSQAAATQAADTLPVGKRELVARQLSHSLETENKYYELTKGSHHAAKAVTMLLDPVTSLPKAGNSSAGQSIN